MVSRTLDVEVDYFVTKIDNARFEAQANNEFVLLNILEEKFQELLDVQTDLVINKDGVFTVSSKNYLLAIECTNAYRINH